MVPRLTPRAVLLALGVLSLFGAGCGAQQHPSAPALVRVVADPPDARVRIDDRDVGSARVLEARPQRVTPGQHQITVEADGYFPHDLEHDFPRGETTLRIELRPIPE